MGPHPPATCLTHREGLWRLLELSKKPIFIVFESQYREITHPAISLLKQHRNVVTLLVWRADSMVRARSHIASTPPFYPRCPILYKLSDQEPRAAPGRPPAEGAGAAKLCPRAAVAAHVSGPGCELLRSSRLGRFLCRCAGTLPCREHSSHLG